MRLNWEFWTASQRRGLIVLTAGILAVLGARLIFQQLTVPQQMPPNGPRAAELADRLDPNSATAQQLSAIPGVGEARAAAIVDYRESYAKSHPGQRAYARLDDLQRVDGIGPAVAGSLADYLVFANDAPTASK